MEQITYQITVKFDQNQASDEHYTEFKNQIKAGLTNGLPAGKGTAMAVLVSIVEM